MSVLKNWIIDQKHWKKNSQKRTQKTIEIFVGEIYSKVPKKDYAPNKNDVYLFDNIGILDISDLKDYGPENDRGYRYLS